MQSVSTLNSHTISIYRTWFKTIVMVACLTKDQVDGYLLVSEYVLFLYKISI